MIVYLVGFFLHCESVMLWPYTLNKLFSRMYVGYILCCHQICFQLSRVKFCTATLTVSCIYAINNSCLSIPGLLFSAGLADSLLSVCHAAFACVSAHLGELCQNPLYDFVSPGIRLQLHLLSCHHKEYFIVLKCVWIPVCLQK